MFIAIKVNQYHLRLKKSKWLRNEELTADDVLGSLSGKDDD
jgi:hypothetical protein